MNNSNRLIKLHYPNTIHHVMIRGNNRQKIFFSHDSYEYFLKILAEAGLKFDHKVLLYCLMTNHIHIVIYVKKTPLSKVMQNICYRYVRWVNKRLNRIGHLFQGRYRSIYVGDEAYLINLCRYIHFNPVAAKMTSTPSEYPWSSHKHYLFGDAPNWIDLSYIEKVIQEKAGISYREFINNEYNREEWKPALQINEQGNLIIDDTVIRENNTTMISSKNKNTNIFLQLPDVVSIAAKHLNTTIIELKSLKRKRSLAQKRAMITFFALQYSSATITEIGDYFNRSATAMQRQHIKIKSNFGADFNDVSLQAIYDELNKGSAKSEKT